MKNYTDINIVIDRSGSMSSIQEQTQSGFEELINKQVANKVNAKVTLFQFDDQYEEVFAGVDVKNVIAQNWRLSPRGMTALHDAIGKSIVSTGERLAALAEKDRPENVLFVIMTDGLENSSKEYNGEKIKEMVAHQKSKYNWEFLYVGADQDAISEGGKYGFDSGKSANFTRGSTKELYGTLSDKIVAYSATCDASFLNFNDSDRAALTSK